MTVVLKIISRVMLSNLCKNYVVQLHDFRMFWFVSYLLDWEMYLLSVTKNPMQPLPYVPLTVNICILQVNPLTPGTFCQKMRF